MVAPLPDIQKEIAKLNTKAHELRLEFAAAYQTYLAALSQSVQPQLVQVCFQLCTERHAEQFLALSLTQRQTLQQDIQKLGHNLGEGIIQQGKISLPSDPPLEVTPESLLTTIKDLEESVSTRLQETSLELNQLLERNNIVKIKSLETLFEIATKAEKAGRSITNPPLLVKAIMDVKEEEEASPIQPLTAIYLQVADLEFADAKLLGARQPIRQLRQSLDRLQKKYAQKLEEEVMAEASAAWRACWYSYVPDNNAS